MPINPATGRAYTPREKRQAFLDRHKAKVAPTPEGAHIVRTPADAAHAAAEARRAEQKSEVRTAAPRKAAPKKKAAKAKASKVRKSAPKKAAKRRR